MAINANLSEADYSVIKKQLWEKFAGRLRAWQASQYGIGPSSPTVAHMNPDVIVISRNNTLVYEPRTPAAVTWLRNRYGLAPEITEGGEVGILVHPQQQSQLTAELKAAGFAVSE